MDFTPVYIPIGVPTFHLESAGKEFDASVRLLKELESDTATPDEMLLSIDKLDAFLDTVTPDLAIVQNVTFANGAYMAEVLRRFRCPVLLWTLREPVIDGGRLRLNSLTGAFSAANMLANFGAPFVYVFGSPAEDATVGSVKAAIDAARVMKAMRSLNILQVGHTPQGFGFGRALDSDMMTAFGANVVSIEARELINKAKTFSREDIADYLADAKNRINGLDKIDEKNVLDFAALYRAYDEYIKANNIGAVSSRCWPDFFTDFGTPVCSVLAILNDLDVPAACEADTYGALTMYIGSFLTGRPAFFGDPVSLDEGENTVTFWHCGMAPCSLARTDTGAAAGLHCNRRIGPTLEFGCKAEPRVTIFRVGRRPDGSFRLFIAPGEALDKPQQFFGTSIVVRTRAGSRGLIESAVNSGWEPHFAVAMGDITDTLADLAKFLKLETEIYD